MANASVGNTISHARNLRSLQGKHTFKDFVGQQDSNDYYRFRVSQWRSAVLSLKGMKHGNADLQILDDQGRILGTSKRSGTKTEQIKLSLDKGIYYARVYDHRGSTPYKLGLDISQDQTANPILQWNNAGLEAIRRTKPGPTLVARDLAILQTGIFDAWAAYDSKAVGTQLGNTLRRPKAEQTLTRKTEALSYAAYRVLADLFPTQIALFNGVMTSLGYDPTNTSTNTKTAVGVGNVAAQALLNFRHNDGSNQLGNLTVSGVPYADYTGYKSVNTPDQVNDVNHWQPLKVSDGKGGFVTQKFATPQWGKVTPFALTSADQFLPPPPKTLQSDPVGFKQQAQDLLDLSANLTDAQKVIAEYWADGPSTELPPGHWNLFAQYVSNRDHHTLDDDAKMFFSLDNALLDTSIATWETKRVYDSARPITVIHELFKDQPVTAWGGPNQGTKQILGQNWQPYQAPTVVTPPFAEYVSGHSAYSAAAAEVLKQFTGSDRFGASYTQKANTSKFETGPATDVTLHWDTFTEAADQAGMSRRYGGIHFADGDLSGRSLGRQVGDWTWTKAQSYINPQKTNSAKTTGARPSANTPMS
ncbi:MAG TPA: vanadium-dependent haloperoxidase [Coleofasciculaceae cyanobacterium]